MKRFVAIIFGVSVLTAVSCRSSDLPVGGTVTVDGAPLEEGTIHFRLVGNSTAKEVGAAVHEGEFTLPMGHKLGPGEYNVSVEGFKKTGRMLTDPQRGKVAETIQIKFRNSPQKVDLSSSNSNRVQIELKTAA